MSPISLPGRPESTHGSAQHERTSGTASDPLFALVLRELAARGLTDAASASTDDEAGADSPERPWFIGLLLGASGWLAGLFVLVFVAVLLQLGSPTTAGGAGALLLAAAWALFMADREGAFTAQLALALSIAGQCLVLYAMNSSNLGLGPLAASTLLLQAALVLVMPNSLHRTLSTFFATIAWALTVRFVLLGEPDPWHGADSGGGNRALGAHAGRLVACVVAGARRHRPRDPARAGLDGPRLATVDAPGADRPDPRPRIRHPRLATL